MRLRSSLLFLLLAFGCTTTTTKVENAPSTGSPDGGGGGGNGGPPINATQLGGACSGFGTGLGETAGFQTEDCPAGVCLVDARTGLDLYCTADCTNATCPDGWECLAVDHGVEKACFKTAGTPDPNDAATPSGFDTPLTGYLAGSKTSTTFPISKFKDPSKIGSDLVVLIVAGQWSAFDNKLMGDLETATISRTTFVSVLVQGPTAGKAATKTDLGSWHTEYPKYATVLDGDLAQLGSTIGTLGNGPGQIEAFPTLIGLDAYTLAEVGRTEGYTSIDDLKPTIEAWRAKTK